MKRPPVLAASVLLVVLSTRLVAQFPFFDNDPPVVTITSHPHESDTAVNASWVTVTATVTDAFPTTVSLTSEGFHTTLPSGGGTVTWTVPLHSEGVNPIAITAVDFWGNTGGDVVLVKRDTMPPLLTGLSPAYGAILGKDAVEMAIRVVDATHVQVSIVGVPSIGFGMVAPPGGIASGVISLEQQGLLSFVVRAIDSAGNITNLPYVVYHDATAPQVTITSPAGGATFGPGEQSIVVSALVEDVTATQVVSSPPGISTTIFGSGTASGTFSLAEGANTIQVTATDGFGQMSQAFVSVTLDTTPPVGTIESPANGASLRGAIDFHATALDVLPGSGVVRIDLLVDGSLHASAAAASHEVAFDTTTLPDGLHEFSAVAVDGKGNSSSTSVTARVDNTLPTVAIVDPADGSIRSGNVAFTVNASDAGSGIAAVVMLANGAAPTLDASFTHATPVSSDVRTSQVATTLLPDGSLLLSASATDAAGNEATASVTIEVDNTAPVKKLIWPLEGSTAKGALLVEATADDSNLASLGLFVDDVLMSLTTSTSLTTTLQTTSVLDGELKIKIVAMDLGGNISISTAKVKLDNLAVKLDPQTLNLKSKGGTQSVTARVTGVNAALLLPTEANSIELRVPGGNSVPSATGWSGDDAVTTEGGMPELAVKFDRSALIAAIRAGLASGSIPAAGPVTVTLVARGRAIGTDSLRITGE
jgi:large repetitive protein